MASRSTLPIAISQQIWDMKYRFKSADGELIDETIEDSWRRVAKAAAKPEGRRRHYPKAGRSKGNGRKAKAWKARQRKKWELRFYDAMADFAFLPAGRILAGAGTHRRVTLFNCFVMGRIEDDLKAIFANLQEAALTMQQGGGIGHDFSTLRPKGALVASIGAPASGPVSFMDVWDAMCRTIMSAGARRGAMMGTMRCDHPDIFDFIIAKAEASRLRNFNLSVLVSDDFIQAVRDDAPWDLVFDGKTYRTVAATELWQQIMQASFDYAEPGVIFIDRINAMNNLSYCEKINCTNPCGEQPLPPHGACLLGSINLAALIDKPFSDAAALNEKRLDKLVATAVRFLDNIIDISDFPLPAQAREARAKRRIGLGVTGLADALIMAGLDYGSSRGRKKAARWMARLQRAAYLASSDLAAEKGPFPLFDKDKFLAAPGPARMDKKVRKAIARHGMRNGLVTSIAPTGTISLLAGNLSSGIEPVFDFTYKRRILDARRDAKAAAREEIVEDYAYRLFRQTFGDDAALPDHFVTARQLPPSAHLKMQATVQAHVDSSISKTINCPPDMSFAAFKDIYLDAYDLGLKGCTTFRPNPVTGSVLSSLEDGPDDGFDDGVKNGARERVGDAVPGDPALAITTQSRATGPATTATAVPPAPAPPSATKDGAIVYMAQPLQREPVLQGKTYKLQWPGSDHAIYVTINDIERESLADANPRRARALSLRPFEIFINSKNLEHYAWTVALTRMISAVFRRGGDVSFVVDELKAIFDPQGGQWMDGHYVPSLLAAIGEIIETHMISIGFLRGNADEDDERDDDRQRAALGRGDLLASGDALPSAAAPQSPDPAAAKVSRPPGMAGNHRRRFCPRCAGQALQRKEGCWICRDCGFSRCS